MPVPPYLPPGMPIPVPEPDGLSAPFWSGLREERLRVQRCAACRQHQFGPEWLCHHCHGWDLEWVDVEPVGTVYSWTRIWHPTHPALKDRCPYLTVVVELPQADGIRLVGNLLGDERQQVVIGSRVTGVFEHHPDTEPPYTLLQWQADPMQPSNPTTGDE